MVDATIVLIHGAWSGAWCWRDLALEFDRRGVQWVAVDLPSSKMGGDPATSLTDDAAAVASVVPQGGPVVLVAHSYGGAVLTEVVPRLPTVQQSIFVAALVPQRGQSATDCVREVNTKTSLDTAIEVEGEFLSLNSQRAAAALYEDCDPDVAVWAVSRLSTQTVASFRSARTSEDSIAPTRYILCSNDHSVDPELQSLMAARCDDVVTIASGHCPFLSQPLELADLILQ